MSLTKKALQRKREKKKNKRKIKTSHSSSSAVVAYENWPIHECWAPIELWEKGIGQVVLFITSKGPFHHHSNGTTLLAG